MLASIAKTHAQRKKRALRVRKKLRGTATKPRLSVFKSNVHLSVQLIDDENSRTLGSISTFATEFKGTEFARKSRNAARKLGACIAEIAKEQNIQEVTFDRGCYKYHGTLLELADAARAGGLRF